MFSGSPVQTQIVQAEGSNVSHEEGQATPAAAPQDAPTLMSKGPLRCALAPARGLPPAPGSQITPLPGPLSVPTLCPPSPGGTSHSSGPAPCFSVCVRCPE